MVVQFESTMTTFWSKVARVQASMLCLQEALREVLKQHAHQGEPTPKVKEQAEEQIRAVCNRLRAGLSAHGYSQLPSNQNPNWDWNAANSLMEAIPQEWEEAEKLLASIEDAEVVSAWDAVKHKMESLSDSWGKAKEIKEQG